MLPDLVQWGRSGCLHAHGHSLANPTCGCSFQAYSRLAALLMELRHGAGAADALTTLAELPACSGSPSSAAEARRRLAEARAAERAGGPDHYRILSLARMATADEVGCGACLLSNVCARSALPPTVLRPTFQPAAWMAPDNFWDFSMNVTAQCAEQSQKQLQEPKPPTCCLALLWRCRTRAPGLDMCMHRCGARTRRRHWRCTRTRR